jgi:hypothetical protein
MQRKRRNPKMLGWRVYRLRSCRFAVFGDDEEEEDAIILSLGGDAADSKEPLPSSARHT